MSGKSAFYATSSIIVLFRGTRPTKGTKIISLPSIFAGLFMFIGPFEKPPAA
jgi:hypothetical protein